MSKKVRTIALALAGFLLLAVLVYQIPKVKSAVDWRTEKFGLYVKNVLNPPGPVPTALPTSTPLPTGEGQGEGIPTSTPEPVLTPTSLASPTATFAPLPAQVQLTPPAWEQQTPNNCGPATLSMALHMYGWTGTQADIAALQGLTERVTAADGRVEERGVAQVAAGDLPPGAQVEWYGSMHLDHGGEYELRGEGGLQVFVDGQPWAGRRYLGRGLYGLRVVRPAAASGEPRLLLGGPDGPPEPIAPRLLFRFAQQHGLLGTYYRGMNWEGDLLFRQVTPFLMLAWPGERPLVPDGEFSARYTGALRVAEGGHYRLRVEADDGARLTLDGQVLGEGLVAGQPNSFDAEVDLAPGDHPIQVDYFQQGGGTALRLIWSRDGGPETPVPPAALVPAQP